MRVVSLHLRFVHVLDLFAPSNPRMPELEFASGAREPHSAMRPGAGLLSEELCQSIVGGSAHTPRMHETAAVVHKLCYQSWNSSDW
jgi:hypothetical protein